jgi:hypothetical protein
MGKLTPALVLFAALSQPALASQTLCVFSTDTSSDYYELEFIGNGDERPLIVFTSTRFRPGERFTLSPENYTLKDFNEKARRVDLEFLNPGNPALPPSFGLVGNGGRAWLKTGSTITEGSFTCDF